MDTIFEAAINGKPVQNYKLLDCHAHMGLYFNFSLPQYSAEDMISIMDRFGMDTVCIAPHMCIGPDYIKGNDMMIDAVTRYPGRFLGYISITPYYGGEMAAESERCFAHKGVIGYKFHPGFLELPMDHPIYQEACARANKRNQPVLIHVWGMADVLTVEKLAEKYPNTVFIMGHAGAEIAAMKKAGEVARNHANVYIDTALSTAYQGNAEYLVDCAGADKVLYGSDLPFFDMRHSFGKVALSTLCESDKAKILGGNMQKIIDNIR